MGEAASTLELDGTFAGYRVIRPLGKGGMSDVYLVERAGPHGAPERFALKVVLPQFQDDPERSVLFAREVRIAASLRHPNIVGVVDCGELDDVRYLVLEHVDGLDLRTLCNRLGAAARAHGASYPGQARGALPPPVVAWIGLGAARGLHAAHMQASEDGRLLGFVHRDVAPGNLFLDVRGQVKVADFGISKAIHAETEAVSTTAQARGRTFYMAPEQIGGDLTRASDLYSLGVVLFELLAGSGRHPFEDPRYPNQDPIGLMARAGRGRRAFTVSEMLPGLPSRLHALLEQLAHPDPAQRPRSAEVVADELAAVIPQMGMDLHGAAEHACEILRLVYEDASQDDEPSTALDAGEARARSGVQPSATLRSADPEKPMSRVTTGTLEAPTAPEPIDEPTRREIEPSTPTTGIEPAGSAAAAQHQHQPITLEVGARVGVYEILDELGQGGMGATYVARRTDVEKRVCLKVIRAEHAADPRYRRMFLDEARIAASVSHPNLVSLIDYCPAESPVLWAGYEIVDGVDLNSLVKKTGGCLHPDFVALIAYDSASGRRMALVGAEPL